MRKQLHSHFQPKAFGRAGSIANFISATLFCLAAPMVAETDPREREPASEKAERLDLSQERIAARIDRLDGAKGAADLHMQRGRVYRDEANRLYSSGRYKKAFGLYEKATEHFESATRKFSRERQKEELSEAYIQLGLVCERIRNDKTIALECFRQAHELNPEDGEAVRKLTRTKEGREALGEDEVKEYVSKRGGKKDV